MVLAGDLAGHGRGVGGGHLVVEGNAVGGRRMVDAVEAPHEIEMPPATTEFAVGDHVQASGLLPSYEFGDRLVFDGLERGGVDFVGREVLACGFQFGRAQVGADHVGAERRVMLACHWNTSFTMRTMLCGMPSEFYPHLANHRSHGRHGEMSMA